MTNQKSKNRLLLKVSLIANAVFVLLLVAYIVSSVILYNSDLNIATYNALTSEMCGEKYQKYIQEWGEARGEEGKKQFAATVCLRDYKTGKDLNLESLLTP
jgi:hypothetical protein